MPANNFALPRELKDEIFSHLIDDKPTLALCTTLSYEWAPSAKAALFRTVIVDNDSSEHDFLAFRSWLSTPHVAEVAKFIRKLHFRGITTRRDVVGAKHLFSVAGISAVDVALALNTFPALHSLHFERTALQSSEDVVPFMPLRSLRCLDMNCTFYDISPPGCDSSAYPTSGLVQILNLFSTIDVLRVSHVTPYRATGATSASDAVQLAIATGHQLSPTLNVRRLISHGGLAESHRLLFEMLTSWPAVGTEGSANLTALEVVDKASAFNAFIKSAGPGLTRLALRLIEERIPEDIKVRLLPCALTILYRVLI